MWYAVHADKRMKNLARHVCQDVCTVQYVCERVKKDEGRGASFLLCLGGGGKREEEERRKEKEPLLGLWEPKGLCERVAPQGGGGGEGILSTCEEASLSLLFFLSASLFFSPTFRLRRSLFFPLSVRQTLLRFAACGENRE